jgi:hypothetical protein
VVSSSRFPFPHADKGNNEDYINTVRWIPQLACLHPSGLWGRECGRETCVLAPSVFTRSKLTIRPLAHSELGNIFSIPQVFMPILEQYPDVAFWTCVPGNLVVRVWDNMRALISDASVGESRLVNAPAPASDVQIIATQIFSQARGMGNSLETATVSATQESPESDGPSSTSKQED